jgi:hypothetical protein
MPETSTMLGKQNFAAFSTVTDAPFGPSFGASGSSAARVGEARARQSRAARGRRSFREGVGEAKGFIGVPVQFQRYRYQRGGGGAKRTSKSGCKVSKYRADSDNRFWLNNSSAVNARFELGTDLALKNSGLNPVRGYD